MALVSPIDSTGNLMNDARNKSASANEDAAPLLRLAAKMEEDRVNADPAPPRKLDHFRTETITDETARMEKMRVEDPARWQRITVTSKEFYEAVEANNVHEARRIAASMFSEEFLQEPCFNAFFLAVQFVSVDLVRLLVTDLGLPFHQHPNSQYCVHTMIQHMDVLQFRNAVGIIHMLYRGPDALPVDARRPTDGWTPLCVAAARGIGTVGWEFLQLGANVNCRTPAGMTPLSLARAGLNLPARVREKDERCVLINLLSNFGGNI